MQELAKNTCHFTVFWAGEEIAETGETWFLSFDEGCLLLVHFVEGNAEAGK